MRSQQTWGAAAEAGVFADEITPITLKIKKKEVEMKLDEHPKPKTTLEQLAKLPPVFKKGGVVTAGGASGAHLLYDEKLVVQLVRLLALHSYQKRINYMKTLMSLSRHL